MSSWLRFIQKPLNELDTTKRRDTKNQKFFQLTYPQPVWYDFRNPSHIKITVPVDRTKTPREPSQWYCERHFHLTTAACETITYQTGAELLVYREKSKEFPSEQTYKLTPTSNRTFNLHPGEQISWQIQSTNFAGQDVEVLLDSSTDKKTYTDAMIKFYHTVASAINDAERYFTLSTTPFPIRYLYQKAPRSLQSFIMYVFLGIQLRVIYYKNDYWTYQGQIPWTIFWTAFGLSPPLRVDRWQMNSVVWISYWVLAFCYWFGTRFLGMEADYEEYSADLVPKDPDEDDGDGGWWL